MAKEKDARSQSASNNVAVLIEAKTEYNKYLVGIFKDNIISTFKKLYSDAENLCMQENTPENILMVFQDFLSKINKWSAVKLNQEFTSLKQKTGCDWVDDLIKVIYVTTVKIMTMTNKIKKDAQIQVKVPTGGQFYHLCILEVARQIWRSPYLFVKIVGTVEYQKNMREVDKLAGESILEVLRVQMPVKNIIMDYIETDNTAITPANELETPAILSKSVIKEVVKKDLARINNPVEQSRINNPVEQSQQHKSKLAKLLHTPAKQMTRAKDPLTDLIDIDDTPTPPPNNHKYLKQLFNHRVAPAPSNLIHEPITKMEPSPLTQAPATMDKNEPVMLEDLPSTKPAALEEENIQASATMDKDEPVMLDDLPSTKPAELEEEKIQTPAFLPNNKQVILEDLQESKPVKPEEQKIQTPENGPDNNKQVMLDALQAPKPEEQKIQAPKQYNSYPASNKLASLLAPDELADLDFELEELNLDDIIAEQKVMKPIKVKKAAPFVFFKNAPSYPSN